MLNILEQETIIFKELDKDKSVIRIKDTETGISSFSSLELNDLSLDINNTDIALLGGNIDLSNSNIKINTTNANGNAICAASSYGRNRDLKNIFVLLISLDLS